MVQHAARRHRDAGKALKLHAAEWLKADPPLTPQTDQHLAPRSPTPSCSPKPSRSNPSSPDAPRKGWGVLRASVRTDVDNLRTEVDDLLDELTLKQKGGQDASPMSQPVLGVLAQLLRSTNRTASR